MVMYKSNLASGVSPASSANKHFIWLKLRSIHFELDEDIFVCGLYLPPSNFIYHRDQDIDIFYQLTSDVIKYSTEGQIIITGDLNPRLGKLQEELSYIDNHSDEQSMVENIESLPIRTFMEPISDRSGEKSNRIT